MALYLLKSSACLAILLLFYKLFLEGHKMHTFKRLYLLAALALGFGIPLLTFTQYVHITMPVYTPNFELLPLTSNVVVEEPTKYLPYILWSIYGIGVLVFSMKFIINSANLFKKIHANPKEKLDKHTNVLLAEKTTPHTFLAYIFLYKKAYENNEIPQEVLLHEITHAQQKHSVDVLLVELLQILFWFNPLVYFFKHSIKLNHEFLADHAVLKNGANATAYGKILLAFSSAASEPQLANSINYSSIKKRFTVMKKRTSKQSVWLRSLITIPVAALLLYGFSTTETKEILVKSPYATNSTLQEKATPKMVAEFNSLAKKYNAQPIQSRVIKLKDINRLEYIYKLMSQEQKKDAQPFPECPPPPPAPKAEKGQRSIIPPPPPPLTPTTTDSKEMQKAKTAFYKEANAYSNAINAYIKDDKGDAADLKTQYETVMILYKKYKNINKKENSSALLPPPPPPAPRVKKGEQSTIPPPPPPQNPTDHIISMAKKGASFSYEGNNISSDKAIALLKKNNSLNIQTTAVNSSNPRVEISTEPISVIKTAPIVLSIMDMPFNGPTKDLSDPVEMIKYMVKNGAKLYFEGAVISEEKSLEIIKDQKSVTITKIKTPHNIPTVLIGGENGC